VFFLYIYREPRGFGFVKYRYGEDAAEAKQQLNHTIIGGREIRIVFAEENRKTPQEMRTTSHGRYNSISATPFLSWNLPLIGINYLLDQSVLDSVFLFFSLHPRKKKSSRHGGSHRRRTPPRSPRRRNHCQFEPSLVFLIYLYKCLKVDLYFSWCNETMFSPLNFC